jgi:K(+)-stimulated pyrophosphate-energized sodium pump
MWSEGTDQNTTLRVIVALVALAIIVVAVTISKRRPVAMASADEAAEASDKGNSSGGTAQKDSDATSLKV